VALAVVLADRATTPMTECVMATSSSPPARVERIRERS
jgi:hypothetical protein